MKLLIRGVGVLILSGCSFHGVTTAGASTLESTLPHNDSNQEYHEMTRPGTTSSTMSISGSPNTAVDIVSPTDTLVIVYPRKTVQNVIPTPAIPVATNVEVSTTSRPEDVSSDGADKVVESEFTEGVYRRPHLRFKGKATEDDFLNIVAKKQAAFEAMQVLAKLYQEKNDRQQQSTASLQEQFEIKPDGNYQYDVDSMTIVEIVQPAYGNDSAKTQLHMKLNDSAAAQTFVRLATAKKISVEEMASLQVLYREKQMELAEYDRRLAKSYAVVTDRKYQYDLETKTLFEWIQLPEGVEVPKSSGDVPVK